MRLQWHEVQTWPTALVGRVAEAQAAELISRQSGRLIGRNVKVGRGEVDLLAVIAGERTVVEVRSTRQQGEPVDPLAAFNEAKARRVRRLANRLGAARVDLIVVNFSSTGIDLHWVPMIA
jgi:Holliday junction resolvase-like predicted endonuclease